MRLKEGVIMAGLHPVMRHPLREAERVWMGEGRAEGVTVTSALDGEHSAASWHYYGLALDFRTHYFNDSQIALVADELTRLLPAFDVVIKPDHIHVEIGNTLAKELGVFY